MKERVEGLLRIYAAQVACHVGRNPGCTRTEVMRSGAAPSNALAAAALDYAVATGQAHAKHHARASTRYYPGSSKTFDRALDELRWRVEDGAYDFAPGFRDAEVA